MSWSNKLTFLTSERTVINHKIHRKSRLRNLLEWYCNRVFYWTESITDMDISNTWNSDDFTNGCFAGLNLFKTVKCIKLSNSYPLFNTWVVVVDNHNFLINFNLTIINFTNTDSTYKFVIINSRNKHLCISIRISFWCRYIINDTFK